ncbi:DinB family protein [Muriicola sp.]|uniref:DinB family protein n=1 Tax=Muriicola sp. TaxID=2020856 RepID=UPI00356B5C39
MPNNRTSFIAKNLEGFHFGGNWTAVNLQDALAGLTWEEAHEKIASLHSIAELVYHINYFIKVVNRVLQGQPLAGKDSESFDVPKITSQEGWEAFLKEVWDDARTFTRLARDLPDQKLNEIFSDPKYGTYERNLYGLVEHGHYHLGQIVLIRKLLKERNF